MAKDQRKGTLSRRSRRGRLGGTPGQILVDPEAPRPRIRVVGYGEEAMEEVEITEVAEIAPILERFPHGWINVDGLGDAEILGELGRLFRLHPLVLEDVVNVPQRAKVEAYGTELFIVAQMLNRSEHLEREQLSLYLGERFLLTFQERPGDPLDPVRERLRVAGSRIRARGPDYLTYAIVDAVLDHYFPVLESLQVDIGKLEDELRGSTAQPLERIRLLRDEVLELQRTIGPLRDVCRALMTAEWPVIHEDTKVFLRDCYDHAISAGELLEACRQMTSGLMDIHLSTVSYQTNDTMKVLTIIATIFMPLSFLAGIYGMNFNTELPGNMPELDWPYGYLGALGAMAAIGVGLVVWFRRKGWF
jgi:magnesium transporter